MKVLVIDLIKSLDYSLNYFLKILSRSGVKSRIVLDEEDLIKLLNYVEPCKNGKSYNLYIVLENLLNDDKGCKNVL